MAKDFGDDWFTGKFRNRTASTMSNSIHFQCWMDVLQDTKQVLAIAQNFFDFLVLYVRISITLFSDIVSMSTKKWFPWHTTGTYE